MRVFKHWKEKQNNEFENLHKVNTSDNAGLSGGYKAAALISTVFIVAALLASAPLVGSNKNESVHSDIFVLANERLNANDYSGAIELFKQAIKINPMDEELYIGLADSYSAANESDKARETLETGYIETKSETIKTELEKLEESESKPLEVSLEKPQESSDESSEESKAQESSEESKEPSQSNESSEESSQIAETAGTVTIKTLSDENLQRYSDMEIFHSTAEWFELNSKENLVGTEKINNSIRELLNKYFKLNPTIYGADGEDEIYYLVKSKNKRIETKLSAKVTYNSAYILSYVVDIDIQAPNAAASSSAVELHTVDMQTGNELSLNDIISGDESKVKKLVKEAFAAESLELSDSDLDSIKFYLDTDKIVLISASSRAYISLTDITDKDLTNESSENTSETR